MDIQTAVEGIGGMHPGKPKEEASLQAQTHMVEEGKGNHLGSGTPGKVVAAVAVNSG
jgi:hypothetical protein